MELSLIIYSASITTLAVILYRKTKTLKSALKGGAIFKNFVEEKTLVNNPKNGVFTKFGNLSAKKRNEMIEKFTIKRLNK